MAIYSAIKHENIILIILSWSERNEAHLLFYPKLLAEAQFWVNRYSVTPQTFVLLKIIIFTVMVS